MAQYIYRGASAQGMAWNEQNAKQYAYAGEGQAAVELTQPLNNDDFARLKRMGIDVLPVGESAWDWEPVTFNCWVNGDQGA